MKTWIVPQGATEGSGALKLVDQPSLEPGRGEVKIAVKAWSTNFRDILVAGGQYFGGPVPEDRIPLSDGAGEIVAVGEGVTVWKLGDRVAGTFFQNWTKGPITPDALGTDLGGLIDGMLAEEVILSADGVVRIPDHLTFEEAATLACAGVTAWSALFEIAKVKPGGSVLTLGTGGVSVFAVQLAVAAGLRVIATSSSDEKLTRIKELGADETINYVSTPDWDQEVLRRTHGLGVDAVIETGGAGTLLRSLNALRLNGVVAIVGVLSQPDPDANPILPMIGKAATLQATYVGSRAMFEDLNRFLEHKQIKPVIHRVFSFEEAPLAYEHQASGRHFGKVVISENA